MQTVTTKFKKQIPVIGLGTWQLTDQDCINAIQSALKLGYRHIDTAHRYHNQSQIGLALKQSYESDGITRQDLWLTSKLWVDHYQPHLAIQELDQTLQDLQTEYLDLWLIHWPHPALDTNQILEVMIREQQKGKVGSIGLSNFPIKLLQKISDHLFGQIEVCQFEFHPSLYQQDLLKFCQDHQIVVEAYSPLIQGEDLHLSLIKKLAQKYALSEAQIILNWIITKDVVAIPRSCNPSHQKDNLASAQLKIDKADHQKIDNLKLWNRLLRKPEWVDLD